MSEARSVAVLPGGPGESEPVSRDPVSGVDLEKLAAISAALAIGGAPRARTLAEHGFTEASWLPVEHTWLLRVATAGLRSDRTFLEAYEAATARALTARAGPPRDVPIEVCAEILVEIERGGQVALALSRAHLAPAQWARVEVELRQRAARDPRFAGELRAALESERFRRDR